MYEELKNLHLTPNEIKIYLFLVEYGVASSPKISRATKIARTNTYHVLDRLIQKGLIDHNLKGKRKVYYAKDPESLYESVDEAKKAVGNILPALKGLYHKHENKPQITYYEGLKEIQVLYNMALDVKDFKIFAIGSTQTLSVIMQDYIENHFVPELKKRNIIFHDILESRSEKYSQEVYKKILNSFYDTRIIGRKHEIYTDILIWDDMIALVSLKEPFFGTVIRNTYISQTFKTLYNIIWNAL